MLDLLVLPSCWKPLNKYLNSNSLRIKNWLNFGVLGVQYGIILNLTLYFICWSRNFVTNSLMWWFNWARHWPDQVVSSLQSSSDHRHHSRRPQSGTLGEKTDVRKMFFSEKNISNLGSEEKHRENMGRKSVRKKPGSFVLKMFETLWYLAQCLENKVLPSHEWRCYSLPSAKMHAAHRSYGWKRG